MHCQGHVAHGISWLYWSLRDLHTVQRAGDLYLVIYYTHIHTPSLTYTCTHQADIHAKWTVSHHPFWCRGINTVLHLARFLLYKDNEGRDTTGWETESTLLWDAASDKHKASNTSHVLYNMCVQVQMSTEYMYVAAERHTIRWTVW